jgi:protoporphyrinogen oxidase
MNVGVIGGGLSGLAIGYLLNQKKVTFELLEKENECGGLMQTSQEEGYTFDRSGAHIIFSKDERILNFMLNLLKDNVVKNVRNTKVLYKQRYVKYPFENGLADLPKEENFECLRSFVDSLLKKEKGELNEPATFKEWIYYTFGKGIAEKYLIPYNEKIWKYPLEKMDLSWVQRVPNPPIGDVIKSSLGIRTEGYTHQLHFYYPKLGGIQALVRCLEGEIQANVFKNFNVKRIVKEDDKWVVSGGQTERLYSKLVCSMPIQHVVTALEAPGNVRAAAANLRYNSLISVSLGVNKENVSNLSWLYVPEHSILPHKVSFPSNFSPSVAPAGKTSVLAEITCDVGGDVWQMKDADIIDRVTADLDRLNIINERDTSFAKVHRTEFAYVISDINYQENVNIVRNYVTGLGIDLVGRFAQFEYLNMDACLARATDYMNTYVNGNRKA